MNSHGAARCGFTWHAPFKGRVRCWHADYDGHEIHQAWENGEQRRIHPELAAWVRVGSEHYVTGGYWL